jgi:MerR family transcriptional regulator/heat shock protein HspR
MPKRIDENKPLFAIGAVAEILNIKPRMLRLYEERGLITPSRTEGNRRLYSLNDIQDLSYIQYLTSVKRVNIAGVIEIKKLLGRMDSKRRNEFLKEIEKEIEKLPQEQKRAYAGEDDAVSDVIFRDSESMAKQQK